VNTREYISSGIIESYVLGLASAEEIAEVESNMQQYPEIRAAVNEFEARLEMKSLANAVTPPAHLRSQIFDAINADTDTTTKIAPIRNINTAPSNNNVRNMSTWKYVAAASVILFIASSVMNFYFYNNYRTAETSYRSLLAERTTMQASINSMQTKMTELDSSIDMIKDPAMAVIKMPGIAGKENTMATVYWDTRSKDVYVLSNVLPKAPSGKQYQLWAMVDGKPVDAGMIGDCAALCRMKNIPRAQAFAITLEKQGGSPTPDLTQLYVMGKV
jgi:anti-sigma-K factor RskA